MQDFLGNQEKSEVFIWLRKGFPLRVDKRFKDRRKRKAESITTSPALSGKHSASYRRSLCDPEQSGYTCPREIIMVIVSPSSPQSKMPRPIRNLSTPQPLHPNGFSGIFAFLQLQLQVSNQPILSQLTNMLFFFWFCF